MACTDRNPLNREGTSQLNRVLAALDVHYADVDERNSADLILFAKRYATYLNYYDESNAHNGTWQPLMMMDVSVTLATLANISVKRISDYKKLLFKNIALAGNLVQPLRDNTAKQQLKFLFDTLFSLVKTINNQLVLLPDNEYKKTIEDIIKIRMKIHLANLQERFFQDFIAKGLLDYTVTELDSKAPFEVESDKNFSILPLADAWKPPVPDLTITIPPLATDYEKIVYIINHNLFNRTIDSLLNGVASIVARAKELFEKTLVDFPDHTPHYGLFLTFTKLFKTVQDDLNHYTQRHLDFYFKDVLQLRNKNPLPDSVHLTFELQKTAQQQLLKKGILFKGGKDNTGKEISYALTEDVVLNKATVAKIHAQQIDLANHKPLKAFPIANSEDGEGAKLISADKSWFTFGNPKSKKTAKTGFAIASNILFLNEGTRNIVVGVTFENSIPGLKSFKRRKLSCFEASLTGKKDWLDKNVTTLYDSANNRLLFVITITPTDPTIVPYSEKNHKLNFETDLPLLAIYLNQDARDAISYSILCKQKITKVDISVNVSGVKDLMLSSDTGSIDASKPFKPFGDFPPENAGFIIGSNEIFQKKISELTFSFSESAASNPFDTSTYYLVNASWQPFITLSGTTISGIDIQPTAIDFTPNQNLKATTLNGFIKLTNKTSKSIDTYLAKVKTALDGTKLDLVNAANPLQYKLTFNQPASPEEIKISDFSVGYKATSSIDFTKQQSNLDNNLFYHLTPFGYGLVFNDGTSANTQAEKTEKFTLLADVIHNGELYVGFENAEPDTVVSVLFQLAEGSSNPLKNRVALSWFYLTNNVWIQFEKRNVIDRTNNFTQSGIVTLTLPPEISNLNTLFEKGKHWIKAVVEKDIDAVCNLILIQAQAASVELIQDEANEVEFRQIIAAKTISKLVENIPEVKTITQAFDSFNGRIRESDEHYYVRVSERLRHKQRALTIWDYEHILLEQFPQLYKVKCLNHSGFYEDKGVNVFCENLPGHVTIVPIPDLKNNTHANLLKPYTPIGLINNIDEYLKKISSPFVKLHTKNPQFEEIRLEFEVKFHDNLDVSFYTQLLNEDIEKFLCPWAYSSEAEIPFGSKISKSVLLNFVEERPYVDYVTCFELHHLLREGEKVLFEKHDIEEAVATTSRSVLVSYFNESNGNRHIIHSPATCTC